MNSNIINTYITDNSNNRDKKQKKTHSIRFDFSEEEYQRFIENKKKSGVTKNSTYCKMRCLQLVDSLSEPSKIKVADKLEGIREQVHKIKKDYPSVYNKVNQGCKDVMELVSGRRDEL